VSDFLSMELEAALWLPWVWTIKMLDAHIEFLDDLLWEQTPVHEMRLLIAQRVS
jgi:hypothetical protein